MTTLYHRRELLKTIGTAGGGVLLPALMGCEQRGSHMNPEARTAGLSGHQDHSSEEYVWISAHANLPLFVARDHPALFLAAEELGVRVTIAGPQALDIPGLVAAVEQTAVRRPSGMMIVGWEPSALIPAINRAVDSGIPVVCVDADVPASKRLAFIGTDWHEVGVQQGQAMVRALDGRRGAVAMLGLIEQYIDQQAFAGFRSVVEPAGLTVLEPQQDKGIQSEATRVAAALIQAYPNLVGMAGFDSESGAGIGQAVKEAGRTGTIAVTCMDCEAQVRKFVLDGVITACVCQKRELFTYLGVRALYDIVHSPLRFTNDDAQLGISPIPVNYNTGTYVITRENVHVLKV